MDDYLLSCAVLRTVVASTPPITRLDPCVVAHALAWKHLILTPNFKRVLFNGTANSASTGAPCAEGLLMHLFTALHTWDTLFCPNVTVHRRAAPVTAAPTVEFFALAKDTCTGSVTLFLWALVQERPQDAVVADAAACMWALSLPLPLKGCALAPEVLLRHKPIRVPLTDRMENYECLRLNVKDGAQALWAMMDLPVNPAGQVPIFPVGFDAAAPDMNHLTSGLPLLASDVMALPSESLLPRLPEGLIPLYASRTQATQAWSAFCSGITVRPKTLKQILRTRLAPVQEVQAGYLEPCRVFEGIVKELQRWQAGHMRRLMPPHAVEEALLDAGKVYCEVLSMLTQSLCGKRDLSALGTPQADSRACVEALMAAYTAFRTWVGHMLQANAQAIGASQRRKRKARSAQGASQRRRVSAAACETTDDEGVLSETAETAEASEVSETSEASDTSDSEL